MDYRVRLRKVRMEHHLSQAEVAEILGMSQQGYSHIENGRAELKIDKLIKLCKFYKVSADYLSGYKNH